jgi:hypothetical protein
MYMGWQHAIFGNPVVQQLSPPMFSDTSDLFWFRFQIFF